MKYRINVEVTITNIEIEATSREHAEQAAMCLVTKALSADPEFEDFGDQLQGDGIEGRPGLVVKPVKNHQEARE